MPATPLGPSAPQSDEVPDEGWGSQAGCLVGESVGNARGLQVMVAAMLQKQGTMREVTVWESEVEAVMREMVMVVGEGQCN